MVMEVGQALASSRWTSTSPRPFGPAPGMGGLGSTRWTSNDPHPFSRAPGAGVGGLSEYSALASSGFSATPADADDKMCTTITRDGKIITAPCEMGDERVRGAGRFIAKKEPIAAGQIPSMVVRFRFTDRGSVTKAYLDKNIKDLLRVAKMKTSRATSFQPTKVAWKWREVSPGFYLPFVASPAKLAGIQYHGNHLMFPVEPTAANLAKLPNEIWTYTVAVTTAHNTMTDGDAAMILALLKKAVTNMVSSQSDSSNLLTIRGCPQDVFDPGPPDPIPSPVKTGFSALILLAAYNMIAPHIGSERL